MKVLGIRSRLSVKGISNLHDNVYNDLVVPNNQVHLVCKPSHLTNHAESKCTLLLRIGADKPPLRKPTIVRARELIFLKFIRRRIRF